MTDADRGTSLVVQTNEQGQYVASPLKIGYNVAVEETGFKKALAGPIEVNVQERPEVNLTLQVGGFPETVTVVTQSPQLETKPPAWGKWSIITPSISFP